MRETVFAIQRGMNMLISVNRLSFQSRVPALLLQKPHARSKSREHVKCLERRLLLWCEGDIDALLVEGQTIQQHLQHSYRTPTTDSSRVFACTSGFPG